MVVYTFLIAIGVIMKREKEWELTCFFMQCDWCNDNIDWVLYSDVGKIEGRFGER